MSSSFDEDHNAQQAVKSTVDLANLAKTAAKPKKGINYRLPNSYLCTNNYCCINYYCTYSLTSTAINNFTIKLQHLTILKLDKFVISELSAVIILIYLADHLKILNSLQS